MTDSGAQGRLTAAGDQLAAGLAALAPVLRSYHRSLVREGFTEPQALILTRDYQRALLAETEGPA